MSNPKTAKRRAVGLIPYRLRNGQVEIYLQKRSSNAPRSPNLFALFGGGIEAGENREEALKREIKEELNFVPTGYEYLGEYETEANYKYIYILKVGDDFENSVKVLEGQYGKFFRESNIPSKSEIADHNELIIGDLFGKLRSQDSFTT